ncbi:MAG: potassium channel protein [Negativicutes bacterium]|jgi:voltage-gated potassium channel
MLKRAKFAFAILAAVIFFGSIGAHYFENLSWVDSFYFTFVTIGTVGYGDIVPVTVLGKIYACFLIIVGVGTAYYTIGILIKMIIEGEIVNLFGRQGMERHINGLKNHIIVCGCGRVGRNVVKRLKEEKEKFVVIESQEKTYKWLVSQQAIAIFGDATTDEQLKIAGIERARGIITTMSSDADNVYVALAAKSLNPNIFIVSRAERDGSEDKLRKAGADTVIFPSEMSGRQMVRSMTKPIITDLLENVFFNENLHLDMAQVKVCKNSSIVGRTIHDSDIKHRYNTIIVAIKRGEDLITNPISEEILESGDVLIVIGHRSELEELSAEACIV